MKILITGINGLLGTALADYLAEYHEINGLTQFSVCTKYKSVNVDITDKQAVYLAVSRLNPDIVIHTAALSNVDECERNPDLAFKVNSIGTRNIALACQRFDASLLYISTDYVFNAKPSKTGINEFHPTAPINKYGESKLRGEWYVSHLLNKFLIVRVSWLFGSARNNFVSDMAQSLSAGKGITAASDMISAPTYVDDISPVIAQLIEKGLYGICNLTNSGFTSRAEAGIYIAKLMGKSQKLVTKKRLESLHLLAKRPKFSAMCGETNKFEGIAPLRSWQEAIKAYLKKEKYL